MIQAGGHAQDTYAGTGTQAKSPVTLDAVSIGLTAAASYRGPLNRSGIGREAQNTAKISGTIHDTNE
jgi:hypothetical protein